MRNWLIGTTLLAWLVLASVDIRAQATTVAEFDIPKQSLETALRKVAESQNLQIIFTPADVRGVATAGAKGKFTAVEVVRKLLEGTGLVAVYDGNNAIAVRPRTEERRPNPPVRISSTDPGGGIPQERITVTANKREERLADVAASIAVVTRDEIERRGLVNGSDYLRGIPGVNQVEGHQYGQAIVIRGIETSPRSQNFASGPTVATYFGETPTTNSAGLAGGSNVDIKLVDIERVEVLRGPQGTAFGSSSLGGAVRTIPVAPKLNVVEAKVQAGYSVTSGEGGPNHSVQAVGNFPILQDRVAIRATAYQSSDSGYYRNRAASDSAFLAAAVTRYDALAFAKDVDEVGAYNVTGGRVAALFRLTPELKLTVSAVKQKTETDGIPVATSGTYEQTIMQLAPEHVRRGETGGYFDTDIKLWNATLEYGLGWADLVASHSRIDSDSRGANPFFGHHLALSGMSGSGHRTNASELRMVSQLDGRWNFLAGVYHEKLEDDYFENYIWFGSPSTNPLTPGQRFVGEPREWRSLEQKAAFGEISWKVLPALTLTGGARTYDYDRTVRIDQTGPVFGGRIQRTDETSATGQIYRANASYKLGEDKMVYAGWSQGFRLGRPQATLPASTCDRNGDGLVDGTNSTIESTGILKSDTVDNYEIGAKFTFDRGFTLHAGVFRMEWTDIPVRVSAPPVPTSCGRTYSANAGKAVSEGIDLQAYLQLTRKFRVDVGASYTDARLTEDVPALGARKGNQLAGSSKANANLGIQYDFTVAGIRALARTDAVYVGPFYGDILESPRLKGGDYVKVDVSTRLMLRNFFVDLFVRNLTDKDAFVLRDRIPAIQADTYGHRMRPRTFGIQVGYSF
jgi:iron complex outermembrane recepter protein